MILLSLVFVFGPTRGLAAGHRITLGAITGILLYLMDQILGHAGFVIGLHPSLTTIGPVILISSCAWWALSRGP
jgi:lipopolysaccharide export LptBFGC system permease protein LptF